MRLHWNPDHLSPETARSIRFCSYYYPGKEMERVDLAILGATLGEICSALRSFRPSSSSKIAGNPFSTYIYRDLKLLIGTTGVGKVNAAATAAAALTSFRAGEVWNVGCAGAYGGSGLEIGDVLITENCICADEGILRKEGPMPTSSLEIPLVLKHGQPFYDCFPLDESLARRQIRALLPAGMFSTDPSGGIRPDERRDTHRGGFDPGSRSRERAPLQGPIWAKSYGGHGEWRYTHGRCTLSKLQGTGGRHGGKRDCPDLPSF